MYPQMMKTVLLLLDILAVTAVFIVFFCFCFDLHRPLLWVALMATVDVPADSFCGWNIILCCVRVTLGIGDVIAMVMKTSEKSDVF